MANKKGLNSLQEFLHVSRHATNQEPGKLSIDLAWNAHLGPQVLHDLYAAINSFKALIELNQAAATSLDDRQVKKFSQLNAHAARLTDLVEFLDTLLNTEQVS